MTGRSSRPLASAQRRSDPTTRKAGRDQLVTGLQLGLIIVGGTIGFAIFIVASEIGGALGPGRAALAFASGSLILGLLGMITSYVGARSRLSTALLASFAFGRGGAKFVNLVIAASLVGWFAVISNTLGHAARTLLQQAIGLDVAPPVTIISAAVVMVWITASGIRGIDRLAIILVPLMILFLATMAGISLQQGSDIPVISSQPFTFSTAVSAVVGSYIAGVIIQPDYSRFAVSNSQATWSVFIALALVFPVIQFLSAVPSMALGRSRIVDILLQLDLLLPGFILLLFGAWSSNVLCLYSAGLSVASFSAKIRLPPIIIGLGTVGTLLALVPAQSYLIDFLVILGITIPPIGAIYVLEAAVMRRFHCDLEIVKQQHPFRFPALAAWLAGVGAGFGTNFGPWTMTGIASLDSLLTASLAYILLSKQVAWRGKGGKRT